MVTRLMASWLMMLGDVYSMRADDGTCSLIGVMGTGLMCCRRREHRGLLVGTSVRSLMRGKRPGLLALVVH